MPVPPYQRAPISPRRSHSIQERDASRVFYQEDFYTDQAPHAWAEFDIASGSVVYSGHCGVLGLRTGAADAEGAHGFHFNDVRQFNLKAELFVEFRAGFALNVEPRISQHTVWLGVSGDFNQDPDSIDVGAWFKWSGSRLLTIETDDTTNNNNNVATNLAVPVAQEYAIFQIDFRHLHDVKFLVNGNDVLPETTLDMTNLTDAEALMQPLIYVYKADGSGTAGPNVDHFKAWQRRE